jgi:hypothetical protein
MGGGTAPAEFVAQFGFEFVLGHAGPAGAHGAGVAGRSDVGSAAHDVDLVRILDQTHLVEQAAQIADGTGPRLPLRLWARTSFSALAIRRSHSASWPSACHSVSAVGDQLGQLLSSCSIGWQLRKAEGDLAAFGP